MNLTVRWTMGDWPGRRFHRQAAILLAYSVAWARHVFPKAQLVIVTSNLTSTTGSTVDRIVDAFGARQLDATPWLPSRAFHARNVTSASVRDRNSFWKLAPLRVAPDEHELVLDNDVILWRRPPSVQRWLNTDDGLLCMGDESPTEWNFGDQPYGNYASQKAAHPQLRFCAAIIGWPPGHTDLPHPFADAKMSPYHYGNEQGFMLSNYLNWPGARLLIPGASVPPSVNERSRRHTAARIWRECDGAHFGDHNVGRSTRFLDEFIDRLHPPEVFRALNTRPLQPVPLR